MTFELTLLGTNAALPTVGRSPSAQVLQIQHHYYLIDCGEGTQVRLLEYKVRHSRIRQVFISHLHGDHFFGLIGLLTSWQLSGRRAALDIYSPEGLERMIRIQLEAGAGRLSYPLCFHVLDTEQHALIFEDQLTEVYSLPLQHRIPTTGFLFREKPRPANIRPEKIEEYDIPVSKIPEIKAGADLVLPDGRRVPHQELTRPAPPPRAYAYCSDTRYTESLVPLLEGVNLLYHESTFREDNRERAEKTFHSTAKQAATLAKQAGVEKLVLGHFSSRYKKVEPFAEEAREIFSNTVAGKEGMRIEVPTPERKIED